MHGKRVNEINSGASEYSGCELSLKNGSHLTVKAHTEEHEEKDERPELRSW